MDAFSIFSHICGMVDRACRFGKKFFGRNNVQTGWIRGQKHQAWEGALKEQHNGASFTKNLIIATVVSVKSRRQRISKYSYIVNIVGYFFFFYKKMFLVETSRKEPMQCKKKYWILAYFDFILKLLPSLIKHQLFKKKRSNYLDCILHI